MPYGYNEINQYTALGGNITHVCNTSAALFFKRYLFQRAFSVFKWELPKNWDKRYFLYTLYGWGSLAVINTDKFGIIPQQCGYMGYNVYYQPTHATISNPLLAGIVQPEIGRECELMYLMPDMGGIFDIVDFYGDMMALTAETIGTNLYNSKLAYVFLAGNKAGAESFKKLFDDIQSGKPATVIDKNLIGADGAPAWDTFAQNLGANFITPDLLETLRKLRNDFDTEIGIPNANTDKSERLIVDEVNANNVETISNCAMWLENLQECCARVNNMFGLDISVDWRVKPAELEEGMENGDDGDY